jgi:hypothetical protein
VPWELTILTNPCVLAPLRALFFLITFVSTIFSMLTPVVSFLLLVFTTSQKDNLIPWSASRKLTWEDFKARPDAGSTNAALTSSSINIDFGYSEKGMEYAIRCHFDKTKSWVRIRNNGVLAHEQGHFDLAELYARKLSKAMKDYKFYAKTVGDDVNRIYDNIMKAHHEAQFTYDNETDYSRNKVKQEEWLQKISTDLSSLQPFANYTKKVGSVHPIER